MKISGLNIYPIKSLRGISVERTLVEDRGLMHDRRYMLVDENNELLTQREFSKMATIETRISDRGIKILIDNNETFEISNVFDNSNLIRVRVWQSFCDALVGKDEINEWFSNFLETNCRLVQMPETTRRQINEKFNQGNEVVSFADGYPILIIGENSRADLNTKLEKPIPMNRFRPNIVVADSEAYAEDNWRKIKVGNTTFRSTKPCARCVVTTIDQNTGISDIREPLKTLATYRKASKIYPDTYEDLGLGKNDVLFGQNFVAENFSEEIKIGDKIQVL